MDEREDDTPDAGRPAPAEDARRRGRGPGSYYYDDATGYEVYDPEEDEGGDDGEASDRLSGEDAPEAIQGRGGEGAEGFKSLI